MRAKKANITRVKYLRCLEAKLPYDIIPGNIFVALHYRLKGKRCGPFTSDMRLHIEANSLFTYPDVPVVCGKAETLNNDQFTRFNLLNPVVIFEVLFNSPKSYDRGDKFSFYRGISSLKECILVDALSGWR